MHGTEVEPVPYLSSHPVAVEGPLLQVTVGITQAQARVLRAAGQAGAAERQLLALVDTGAIQSCLDDAIVRALGLAQTGSAGLLSAGGAGQQYALHEASLSIQHPAMSLHL